MRDAGGTARPLVGARISQGTPQAPLENLPVLIRSHHQSRDATQQGVAFVAI